MASIIKLKRSSTPGSVPGSLATGEVALNLSDQVLFTYDGSNVVRIGGKWLANTNSFIKSQLANTNSFIKSQLANTNSWNTTQDSRITLVNTNLTATNTAIRSVISTNAATELSHLANTNTYIATKVNTTTFNSALANTNSWIKSQLANTNTYIATKANATNPTTSGLLAHTGRATISTNLAVTGNTSVTGLKANNSLGSSGYFLRSNGTAAYWDALPPSTQYLQVSNAVATYATKSNPTTSGLLAHTGRATISTNLAVTGNSSVTGNQTVSGTQTITGLLTASGRLTVGTNLTVTGNTVLGANIDDSTSAYKTQTLTDGATITWNAASGRIATVTLGGNRTMAAPTNLKAGHYTLTVIQDGSGSRTLTWNGAFKWPAQTAPTLSTAANARDILTFVSDGTLIYGTYVNDVR